MNAGRHDRAGIPILLATVLLGLAFGCSSTPKVDWDARVNHYTFDEAVLELGPPDRSSELTDGTRVAQWFERPGSSFSFGVGTGYYSGGRDGGAGMSVGQAVTTSPRGIYLQLTFDAQGTLSAWGRVRR